MNNNPQFYALASSIKWDAKDTSGLPAQTFVPVHNTAIPSRYIIEYMKSWIENEYGVGVLGFAVSPKQEETESIF